jgi:hypothetical protein
MERSGRDGFDVLLWIDRRVRQEDSESQTQTPKFENGI